MATWTVRTLLSGVLLVGSVVGFRFLVFPWLAELTAMGEPWAVWTRRGGVLSAALAGYWISGRVCDRGAIPELRPTVSGLLWGTSTGFALISITIATLFATGHYEMVDWRGLDGASAVVGMIFVAVMLEEIFFRGFLFQRFEELVGSFWALVGISALFGALHLFNQGAELLTLVSVALLGALWTAVFVASRNLWVVGSQHCAWNLAIFLSGAPLSGSEAWRQQAPVETTIRGSAWMTGGSFGPENSLLTIAVVGSAFVGVWGWARRHGGLRAADARLQSPETPGRSNQ